MPHDFIHDRREMQRLEALTTRELAELAGRIEAAMHAKGLMGAEHAGRLQALLEAQA
jgi:hypothetical protein